MCSPTAVLAIQAVAVGVQTVSATQQARVENKALRFNAAVAERDAAVSEQQAADASERGMIAEKQHRLRISGLQSTQRSLFAASGVQVGAGSPLDVAASTAFAGESDALTIRLNAAREAAAFQGRAQGFRATSSLLRGRRVNTGGVAGRTLLTGVASIIGTQAFLRR